MDDQYRRFGGEASREIVSFRSCVRASEAVCAREALCFQWVGKKTTKRAPRRSGPVRTGPCPCSCTCVHMGNHFLNVRCGTWGLVFYAFLFELALGETLGSIGETFGFVLCEGFVHRPRWSRKGLYTGPVGSAAVQPLNR